jgi:hypothetical protein
VGKFYDRQRNLVGYYCDIIKPLNKLLRTPEKTSRITDLFLDLWITPEGDYVVLDEDEFEEALDHGYLPKNLADQANGLANPKGQSGTLSPTIYPKSGTPTERTSLLRYTTTKPSELEI